jgi:hypothetical protein
MPFTSKGRGSESLRRLAKIRGLPAQKANQVVEYDPRTGAFGFIADEEAQERWLAGEQMGWLLDFAQGPAGEVAQTDADRPWRSLESFVAGGMNIWNEKTRRKEERARRPSEVQVQRLRRDIAKALNRFLFERRPWEITPAGSFVRSLRWLGNRPVASFIGGDWRTRFQLRAMELLEREGGNIRKCEYQSCGRLFLIHDKRQRFCSEACANQTRLERFRSQMSESDWKARRRSYYSTIAERTPEKTR